MIPKGGYRFSEKVGVHPESETQPRIQVGGVRRTMAGENVGALSRELRVLRKDLYYWRTRFRVSSMLRGRPVGQTGRTLYPE
jgi:PAS domain-containing protein